MRKAAAVCAVAVGALTLLGDVRHHNAAGIGWLLAGVAVGVLVGGALLVARRRA